MALSVPLVSGLTSAHGYCSHLWPSREWLGSGIGRYQTFRTPWKSVMRFSKASVAGEFGEGVWWVDLRLAECFSALSRLYPGKKVLQYLLLPRTHGHEPTFMGFPLRNLRVRESAKLVIIKKVWEPPSSICKKFSSYSSVDLSRKWASAL